MSDWNTKSLGEVAENVSRPFNFKGKEKVIFINTGDVLEGKFLHADFSDAAGLPGQAKKAIKKGDILYSEIRPGNKRYVYVDFDADNYVVSTKFMVVRPIADEVSSEFLYMLLTSRACEEEFKIIADSRSGTFPQITFDSIAYYPISYPASGEQENLVEISNSLLDKIELNRQTNQTLEHIAQAIFKSWFADFEPTRAKIAAKQTGQDPERAAMATISGKTLEDLDQLSPEQQKQLKTTAALFPDALVDSELGEIPEGWEWSEIGNEVAVVGGGTPSTKKEEFWEGGHINWTSPKDMSNLTDKVLLETDRKITEAGLAKISSGLLPINTVLMSSRAPVGYLAISKIPIAINQGYIAMKCEDRLTPEYIVQWADSVMDDIKQRASGTTFAEISKKNFKIIPVIVPEKEVVSEFSQIATGLYEKITEALNEVKSLTETRDALLPRLLSAEMELAG